MIKRLRFKAPPAAFASPDSIAVLLLTHRGNVFAMTLLGAVISMTVSDGADQPRAQRLGHADSAEAARHFAELRRSARRQNLLTFYVGPPLQG